MKKPSREKSKRQSIAYFKLLNGTTPFNGSKLKQVRIIAPVVFRLSLEKERSALLSMITEIRLCVIKNKRVLIDFSKTKIMVADGALIFYAEILRIIDNFPNAYGRLTCTIPSENRIRETLHQIGLLKILNPRCSATSKREDVINWRAAHGRMADGESYDKILGHYEGKITGALDDGLYNGVTEAMTNSTQHAYIAPRKDDVKIADDYKSWWMFSQEKDEMLSVVFCDLGAGIPGTLPITRPKFWEGLKIMFGGTLKDSSVIVEAIKLGRTRTMKPNRGFGLPEMVDIIKGFEGSQIIIHSNYGCYINKSEKEEHHDFDSSIMGTLIFWQVPVEKKQ